jgi:hypothetical protein
MQNAKFKMQNAMQNAMQNEGNLTFVSWRFAFCLLHFAF